MLERGGRAIVHGVRVNGSNGLDKLKGDGGAAEVTAFKTNAAVTKQ